jgi:prepilin-type processing-associated H-X9-DG protein
MPDALPQSRASSTNIERGTLYSHIGNAGVYRCPSDYSNVVDHPGLRRFRGYVLNGELNCWIVADTQYGLPIHQAFHNVSQLERPVRTYGFLDVTAETIDSGIFGILGPAARTEEELKRNLTELDQHRWLQLPGERHSGGSNISFLDGHVERHEWRWPGRKMISPHGQVPPPRFTSMAPAFPTITHCPSP